MLQARWDHHQATWQRGRTLQVYPMRSGWACRLLEHGSTIKTAFPYERALDAMYAAERLANDLWGTPDHSHRG